MTSSPPQPVDRPPRRFVTTHWSLILQTRSRDEQPARQAMNELFRSYWLPVYAFMRQQTRDLHQAQDWTQGLFASLLERDALAKVGPEHGRFRSFLLAAARHFVSNARDHQNALKRGGNRHFESMDFEAGEARLQQHRVHGLSPEVLFERQWALAMLDRVLHQLRELYLNSGSLPQFNALCPFLTDVSPALSLKSVAADLGITEQAARVALHRMRKRYRQVLKHEIAQTTDSASAIDDELRHLFSVLSMHK